jgi:hypothetical protein
MTRDIRPEFSRLWQRTHQELKQRFAELFGEQPHTSNRTWLVKRIAWRLQALAEGDLSERARRRAAELANDADLRLNSPQRRRLPPQSLPSDPMPRLLDRRLPPQGTILTRRYKGQDHQVHVLAEGFAFGGVVYKSLSAVAKAITGSHCNGYAFFRLSTKGARR